IAARRSMSATSAKHLHRIIPRAPFSGAMAALPDLAAAGLYGVVVFLLTLGLLVVFVETVPPRRLLALLLGSGLAAVVLAGLGEVGVALLALGIGAALVANHTFEWLTTRPRKAGRSGRILSRTPPALAALYSTVRGNCRD